MNNPFGQLFAGEQSPLRPNATQPAPAHALATMPRPSGHQAQPQRSSNPLGGLMRGFATGMLGADKVGAIDVRHDQKKAESLKRNIATLQQIRQLPAERRLALIPQISQAIGREVPEAMMSDQEIDSQLAVMMGEAGISPEKREFQGVNLGSGAYGVMDPRATDPSKALTVIRQPDIEPEEPQKLPEGMWYGPDGKGPPQAIPGYVSMRTQIAQGSQNAGGSQSRFRPASREEASRYGAEAGQIDDSTGRFYPSGGQNAGEFSASERKGFRDKAAALNTLKYLTGEYRKVVDKYGPQFSDSEADLGGFRKTNRSQELLAAHNNLMMFLKGPELFNLGVLTGPDVERLQRTLPEPVGVGTVGQNKNTLGVGLDGLDQFVKYKMSLIPEQFHIQDARGDQPGGQQQLGGIMGAVQRGVQQMQPQADETDALDPSIEAAINEAFGPDDDMGEELPPGVTQEEWDNMDEQDRALFR